MLDQRDGLFVLAQYGQAFAETLISPRILWIHLYGFAQFLFRNPQVPFVKAMDGGYDCSSLSQLRIDLQRFFRGGLRLRKSVFGMHMTIHPERDVAFSET